MTLRDKEINLILELEDILKKWNDYAEDFFQDDRGEHEEDQEEGFEGMAILASDVEYVIKCMKNKTDPGVNELTVRMIKCKIRK